MEKIVKNNNNEAEIIFEKVGIIEKEEDLNINWDELEENEIETYVYEIKVLFIGNILSGKSFIINNLIDNYNNDKINLKINPKVYKRTLGLDKRIQQITFNNENFIIKYYEIASNLDFTRMTDDYIKFLNSFDLIFFILNKEINTDENLIFFENFKDSIRDSYLTNENNAKYFFEKRFHIVQTFLNYNESDKLKHIKLIKENKAKFNKFVRSDKSSILFEKEKLFFDIDNNQNIFDTKDLHKNQNKNGINISNSKEGNSKSSNQSKLKLKYPINEIKFDINNFSEFKNVFQDLIYSLFYKKETLKVNSKRSDNDNLKSLDFLRVLTIIKKDNKDVFDFVNKFHFEKYRNKLNKKKIHC